MLKSLTRQISILLITIFIMIPCQAFAESNKTIRFVLDDLPGIDMLNVLTAIERTKKRGVNVVVSFLQSEGITAQAVINGQADIGMGTPYKLIQKTSAPIRMFYQLNLLRFHPVANADYIKSWKDLDGSVMYSHGSGSGTEAIMNMMAKREGIKYSEMRYIPGSGVRARAMLQNRIKATVVDTERRNMLLNSDNGNFEVLPMPELKASDEALYANKDFILNNREFLEVFIEELLYVWRETNKSPDFIAKARDQYSLLPRLKRKQVSQIAPYFKEMVEVGAFPNDGGASTAFAADVDFYGFAGTLQGDTSTLKESDFWDFSPLRAVLQKTKH